MKIGNLTIDEGIPKICVPIGAKTFGEALEEARLLKESEADILEIRADNFSQPLKKKELIDFLKKIKEILEELPFIFTFRTMGEGGNAEISEEYYFQLCNLVVEKNLVPALDIETNKDESKIKKIIEKAEEKNIIVIGSSHDFKKTKSKRELLDQVLYMDKIGIHIPKLAVMPKTKKDLLVLWEVAIEAKEALKKKPLILISMGELGAPSRILCEFFGLAITFAKGEEASAPGQIDKTSLRKMLQLLRST